MDISAIALVKNRSNFLSAKEDEPKPVVEPFSRKNTHCLNNKQHKKKNKKGQQSNLDDHQSKSARVAKTKGQGKPQEQPKESHKLKNASEPPLVLVDVALGKQQESALLPADLSNDSNGHSELVVAEVILASQGGLIAMPARLATCKYA